MGSYFYQFLEDISEELARTLNELEKAIYQSPRSMLTHSRTFIEVLLEKVMIHENMPNEPYLTIKTRIQNLDDKGLLNEEVKHAFHKVRKLGNVAAHDTRQFRFSESLTSWEHIHTIVKWFVEVYESYTIVVPDYVDPIMKQEHSYGLEEMALRFKKIEDLLKESLAHEKPKDVESVENELTAEDKTEEPKKRKGRLLLQEAFNEEPGFIPVRAIHYEDDSIDIPYFLRDAFLLPQRFEESERFLVRLGGEQQARIMSELPNSLEGFHLRVTRYTESHSETFFKELKEFVAEEIRRKKLMNSRPGELFLFYKSSEIVVTEDLGNVEISVKNFTGMPGLIEQLNEDGIDKVRDLPKELLILGKYRRVGKSRVESFFGQLGEVQGDLVKGLV
ncbi:DUF4145 domain-containing protein [Oceanobacillus indicireducens]|uniref:DUF4145 domain-containing protein n=1 Tax=Oceanobacillus indicireducens TaxID=1004261 RepID=A0A917Y3G8_9BACI|nr:DUF4145 domain-containing protein [Oceanobacillus indicireducens]GGN66264.1 hypothetical protein GCM10007971_36040 [Oceanobacillus indicireducens]